MPRLSARLQGGWLWKGRPHHTWTAASPHLTLSCPVDQALFSVRWNHLSGLHV